MIVKQRALDALDQAFAFQLDDLFKGLHLSLVSVPPTRAQKLLSLLGIPMQSDIDAAIARFAIGFDDLIIAYNCAQAVINNKIEETPS